MSVDKIESFLLRCCLANQTLGYGNIRLLLLMASVYR